MFNYMITEQLQSPQSHETIDYNAITSELSAIQSRAKSLIYLKRTGRIDHNQFIQNLRALETRREHLKFVLNKSK